MTRRSFVISHDVPPAVFPRQQSLYQQCLEWESRAQPYRGYGKDLMAGGAWACFLIPCGIFVWVSLSALVEMLP